MHPIAKRIIQPDLRPTDHEYASIAKHVYTLNDSTLEVGSKFTTPYRTWDINFIVSPKNCGYFGAVYLCKKDKLFVIAHRGTNNSRDFIEDYVGVYKNFPSRQKRAAFRLVDLVISQIRNSPDYSDFTVSCTGHSLGAFLAELSVYFSAVVLHYEKMHAVTFESPGSLESMGTICWDPHDNAADNSKLAAVKGFLANSYQSTKSNIKSYRNRKGSTGSCQSSISSGSSSLSLSSSLSDEKFDEVTKSLDIISYLCYPNIVNITNTHVGTVYAINVVLDEVGLAFPFRLFSSHHMQLILDWFEAEKSSSGKTRRFVMGDWPKTLQESQVFFKYLEFSQDENEISLDKIFEKRRSQRRHSDSMIKKKNRFFLNLEGNFDIIRSLTNHCILPLYHFQKELGTFLQYFFDRRNALLKNVGDHKSARKVIKDIWLNLEMPLNLAEELLSFDLHKNKIGVLELVCKKYDDVHDFRCDLSRWLFSTGFRIGDLLPSKEEFVKQEIHKGKFAGKVKAGVVKAFNR